ncbi:MAG: hypothetical protein N3C12_07270 [Candidatus Binatia bacterium]|nr:hypothetical protein [Candidatus Binatia bacterium]
MDRGTAELGNLYVVEGESTQPGPVVSDWAIALYDQAGNVLSLTYFQPQEQTDSEADQERIGLIAERVPWVQRTRRVAILYRGAVVAERAVTFGVPTVEVLYPNGGEQLGQRLPYAGQAPTRMATPCVTRSSTAPTGERRGRRLRPIWRERLTWSTLSTCPVGAIVASE